MAPPKIADTIERLRTQLLYANLDSVRAERAKQMLLDLEQLIGDDTEVEASDNRPRQVPILRKFRVVT